MDDMTILKNLLTSPDYEKVVVELQNNVLALKSRIPQRPLSRAECIDYYIDHFRKESEKRDAQLKVDFAELALLRAQADMMPAPENEEENIAMVQSIALLDVRQEHLGQTKIEVSLLNQFLDILDTMYN
jgi:hypothetical protein